jgi:peptidyl-prolyl cis-trans isomerase C
MKDSPMRKILSASICLALAACSAGGGGSDQRIVQLPNNSPVAETVNGVAVPNALVDAFLRVKAPPGADPNNPQQRAEVLRLLADYVLLAQQAQHDKLTDDPNFAANVEVARLGALAAETMTRLQEQTPITDDALKAQYDAKIAGMGKFEYDLGSLLFPSEEDALKASGELVSGMPFDKVYDEWKGKAQAKALSHINTENMPKSVADALTPMKAGDFTHTPLKLPQGWLLFLVQAVNPLTPPEFDKVKDNIRRDMQKKVGEERLAQIKNQAKIEYPGGAAPVAAKPAATAASQAPATEPQKN